MLVPEISARLSALQNERQQERTIIDLRDASEWEAQAGRYIEPISDDFIFEYSEDV